MKLKFRDVFFNGAIKYNPVLIQCVGLCPVILVSTNLNDSLLMSVIIIADLLITSFIASAMLKKIPRPVRVVLYLIISIGIIFPLLWLFENVIPFDMTLGMRIYIPLVAVNSITAVHCEQFAVKNSVRLAMFDAIAAGFGTLIILIFVGAIREIIGNGTILGRPLELSFKLSGMLMPYGCLIILGFAAAIFKVVFKSGEAHHQKPKEEVAPIEIQPEIVVEESEPEQIDMDLSFVDEDEYAYLLSSVNELIASFSNDDEGGKKQ